MNFLDDLKALDKLASEMQNKPVQERVDALNKKMQEIIDRHPALSERQKKRRH